VAAQPGGLFCLFFCEGGVDGGSPRAGGAEFCGAFVNFCCCGFGVPDTCKVIGQIRAMSELRPQAVARLAHVNMPFVSLSSVVE